MAQGCRKEEGEVKNAFSLGSMIPPLSPLEKGGGVDGMLCFDKVDLQKRGLIWDGYHLPYNARNVGYAQSMRKSMTHAEKKLWKNFLRTFKFRVLRQRPIDNFIADFYCPKLKLIIEVDGGHHCAEDIKTYDEYRTKMLSVYGVRVIRFSNEEVENDFTVVCDTINSFLQQEASVLK